MNRRDHTPLFNEILDLAGRLFNLWIEAERSAIEGDPLPLIGRLLAAGFHPLELGARFEDLNLPWPKKPTSEAGSCNSGDAEFEEARAEFEEARAEIEEARDETVSALDSPEESAEFESESATPEGEKTESGAAGCAVTGAAVAPEPNTAGCPLTGAAAVLDAEAAGCPLIGAAAVERRLLVVPPLERP